MSDLLCRVCASSAVFEVMHLGDLAFTGTFPLPGEDVPSGRLTLAVCDDCGLVQLADTFPLEQLYGDNYGYRSGLNAGMVRHLQSTVAGLERLLPLDGAVVLDIGSNDGTTLGAYRSDVVRIGIDPTSEKFAEFHPPGMTAVASFFSEDAYWAVSNRPARVVTSIAMFYDLEFPIGFARDVHRVLESDGLWHLEVAYAPKMLRNGAYDTICHEHLEYYSLSSLAFILAEAGFKIVHAATNGTNGGSIAVTAAKAGSRWAPDTTFVPWMLAAEKRHRVNAAESWVLFGERVREHQYDLLGLLSALRVKGKATIHGLGASTKGNVLLQSTGIGTQLVDAIGDVNPYKYGRVTPGTHIPIQSEADTLAARPDYLLVLPWHFRDGLLQRLSGYLADGGRVIFPLPDIEVVGE